MRMLSKGINTARAQNMVASSHSFKNITLNISKLNSIYNIKES